VFDFLRARNHRADFIPLIDKPFSPFGLFVNSLGGGRHGRRYRNAVFRQRALGASKMRSRST